MPYLGSAPTTSSQSLVKQDFSVSATQNYTLSQSVTNANDIALYINNVRQEPTTAYSASGTSLTLTEATTGSDDMYCVYIGRAVGTINPASGSVGTSQLANLGVTGAKINTDVISAQTELATTPADTDEFLVSDGGVIKKIDYSHIKSVSGLNKISTSTVSSAVSSVDFPTLGTDYKFFKLVFTDLHASANDLLWLRFTNDNGSSYLAASQYDFCSQNGKNGSNTQYASNATSRVIFGYWNISTYSGHASHGEINFSNPANSSNYASVEWSIKYTDTSNIPVHTYGVGHYRQGTAMTGFQILPGSGNIEAGIFTVYGLES